MAGAASLAGRAAQPDPGTIAWRAKHLEEGEAALMRGDADAALQAFEQAGALGHDPDIELGLVRAAMQAGHYSRALAWAAHTVGEHVHDPRCVVMHAWLLALGGHAVYANTVLTEAMAAWPWSEADQSLLQQALQEIRQPWLHATGVLRLPPLYLAPYPFGVTVPRQAKIVGSGTLVQDAQGVQAVLVSSALRGEAKEAPHWHVRNALGQTVPAYRDDAARVDDVGSSLAVLRLQQPLPSGRCVEPSAGRAFPGSMAYALSYALPLQSRSESEPAAPSAWPIMRMGFLGAFDARGGRLLGIDTPQGPWSAAQGQQNPLGGPVWDARGMLIGVAVGAPLRAQADTIVPVSALRAQHWLVPSALGDQTQSTDELYEQSLRACLQVIRNEARCQVSCDHIPHRSWALFRARDVMRGVIESFKAEHRT